MFNTVFSPQWKFDKCLEGQFFLPWISLIVSMALALFSYKFLKNNKASLFKKTFISSLVFISSSFFTMVVGGLIGILITNCNAGGLWLAITPAHKLHAQLKDYKEINGTYPRNSDELEKLDPGLYSQIKNNSKEIYIYNSFENSYTWIVRPSAYFVAIFDTKSDYAVYKISHAFVNPYHWMELPKFPPRYYGPWDELP